MKHSSYFLFSLLLSSSSIAQIDLNLGLVAYYPFSGNAIDVSGNNNNGTVYNAMLTTDKSGNPNSAYYFNGLDTYIKVPASPSLNSTRLITVALKMFKEGDNFERVPISRYKMMSNGWGNQMFGIMCHVSPLTTSSFCIQVPADCGQIVQHNPCAYQNTQTDPNRWYCIVCTFDGTFMRFYVDGVLRDRKPTGFPEIDSCDGSFELFIGKYHTSDPGGFRGKIDEVRIYNRPLNEEEIVTYSNDCGAFILNPNFDYLSADSCKESIIRFNDSTKVFNTAISSYLWQFGDGTTSTQQSPIHEYTSIGNYNVTLTVTEQGGQARVITKNISINNLKKRFVSAGSDTTVCTGQQTLQLQGTGAVHYEWSSCQILSDCLISNPIANISTTEIFVLKGVDANSCIDFDTVTVILKGKEFANAGGNKFVCGNDTIRLNGTGGVNYNWQPCQYLNDCNIANPVIIGNYNGDLVLLVQDQFGCIDFDTISVNKTELKDAVFVPTAFTPNDDGLNDIYKIIPKAPISSFELIIYNRWGEIVFRNRNPLNGWDGRFKNKKQPTGIYTYILRLKSNPTCGDFFQKGTITLIQ